MILLPTELLIGRLINCFIYDNDIYICSQVNFISGESAFELASDDGEKVKTKEICELMSNQEETDTRVVLYSIFGAECGYETVEI